MSTAEAGRRGGGRGAAEAAAEGRVELPYQDIEDLTPLLGKLTRVPNLTFLDLHGNRLVALPRDLSVLPRLRFLNISQNLFSDLAAVLPGLRSLPSLTELVITIVDESEEEALLFNLPNLRSLNGRAIEVSEEEEGGARAGSGSGGAAGGGGGDGSAAGGGRPVREVAMTQEDLESVAVLYGAVKGLRGRLSKEEDDRLTAQFDRHIQTVMRTLTEKLEALEDPFLRQGEILSAKHDLYELCFAEATAYAQSTSPSFGAVLHKLRKVHNDLFSEFPGVLGDMQPYYSARVADLEAEVSKAELETSQLLEAAELLEKEAQTHAAEKDRIDAEFETTRRELLAENERLRAHLSRLGAKVPAESKRGGTAAGSAAGGAGGAAGGAADGSSGDGGDGGSGSGGSGSSGKRGRGGKRGSKRAPKRSADGVRNLSLKQLKDFVDAIYASKEKFDKKCLETRLPRETMEQHMYTFLNQRYGLKSLIIENASSIIKGCARYAEEDNDVAVFHKIIRNEVDEEFRFVQKQLKDTVIELLRVYLKGKYPLKPDDALGELLARRLNGFIYEEEWVDIIKYMYNHDDSLSLIVMLKEFLRVQAEESGEAAAPPPRAPARRGAAGGSGSDGPRARLPFNDFLKVLLDFQLKGHEKFLSRFRRLFRKVDRDKNGVLDEDEFRALVGSMDPRKTEDELQELLAAVDPYNNQHITFSDCVAGLSADLVQLASLGKAGSGGGSGGGGGAGGGGGGD